jgi:ADP-ribose pyrophosphatase YjhB (NUDIX family)
MYKSKQWLKLQKNFRYNASMNKPTDSVRIVIFDRENPERFLVLAEADDPDNWKLPGGKFDTVDETPDAAAARELGEELGAQASDVGLKQAGRLINDDGVSARYIYAGMATEAAIKPSAEIAATQWVTEATIPEGKNHDHILSAVQTARAVLK